MSVAIDADTDVQNKNKHDAAFELEGFDPEHKAPESCCCANDSTTFVCIK